MLFNSVDFGVFFIVFYTLYWFVFNKDLKKQNLLLLLFSYFFYGYWHWSYLALIIFSSLLDYNMGQKIYHETRQHVKKRYLLFSVIINIGVLITFKYYNFFIENVTNSLTFFGIRVTIHYLELILPLGISFYTFQTLSYTIDVYKKRIRPTNDLISFLCFVGFFPQLIAGPIERAKDLLTQIEKKRFLHPRNFSFGLKLFLWGLFKKVVIADQCSVYVDDIFFNYENYNSSTLALGVFLFSIQIYGDFSGYSDMAVGIAKMLGFNLMYNFKMPYFSANLKEFWSRWHISLSSWFKDYVYIPLGGNKKNKIITFRNVFIVFLISGVWHGANWTFVAWGLLHFFGFYVSSLFPSYQNKSSDFLATITTFLFVSFAWIFFRSENLTHSIAYIGYLFDWSTFKFPDVLPKALLFLIGASFCGEFLFRFHKNYFNMLYSKHMIRYGMYYLAVFLILHYHNSDQKFIYFQF